MEPITIGEIIQARADENRRQRDTACAKFHEAFDVIASCTVPPIHPDSKINAVYQAVVLLATVVKDLEREHDQNGDKADV
jgi:hypothetical protein